ncbi:hypothetical protein Lal_00005872 [Lupinus albus]|nr:hypothetical protein Lal_00005872 [Lupinus albus]
MSASQSPWPFTLIRRQFPIIVSYAMIINKSQVCNCIYQDQYLVTSSYMWLFPKSKQKRIDDFNT